MHFDNNFDWSKLAGFWGAALSTFLAVRTIYQSRVRLHADIDLTINAHGHFTVNVTNLTSKPIVINYYNFFFDKKANGIIDIGLHERSHKTFSPNSVQPIFIDDMYQSDFKKSGKLYLEVYITGRKKPRKVLVVA